MIRTEVESSNIMTIGYDPDTKVLEVEFGKNDYEDQTNRIYTYQNVPPEVHQELMDDNSHGGYLCANIARNYPYEFMGTKGEVEPEI